LSPRGSPGVLNEPVVRRSIDTISSDEDSVVKLRGGASGFVVNSGGVELERVVRSIDGDGDGSDGARGNQERGFVSGLDSVVSLHGGSNVGGVELARSVLRNVGVRGFRVDTVVGDDVLEGIDHETSVASLVSERSRAVHQVLLRKTDEGLSSLKNVGSFERSGGRERPARSALSLVLDSGDGVLLSPVHRGGESRKRISGERDGALRPGGAFPGGRSDVKLGSEVVSLEFIVGKISEFVHSEGESGGGGIVGFDEFLVGEPDLVAVGGFRCGRVGLGVSEHPFTEFSDVG